MNWTFRAILLPSSGTEAALRCRDPGDLPALGTAIAAGADCIVSGDGDLLELGSFRGILILGPRALWERISAA